MAKNWLARRQQGIQSASKVSYFKNNTTLLKNMFQQKLLSSSVKIINYTARVECTV